MSAHPDAFSRLKRDLTRTRDRKIQDELLDKWLEYEKLATDWDGTQWGFDADSWMSKERAELDKRSDQVKDDKDASKT